jgi:hypothetical protein
MVWSRGQARRATHLGLAAACLAVGALCIVWGSGGRGSYEEATLLVGEDNWEVVGRGARGGIQRPRELEAEARTIERRQQDRVKRAASVLERAEAKMEKEEGIAGGMLDEAKRERRERERERERARRAQELLSRASSKIDNGVDSDGGLFSSSSLSSLDGSKDGGDIFYPAAASSTTSSAAQAKKALAEARSEAWYGTTAPSATHRAAADTKTTRLSGYYTNAHRSPSMSVGGVQSDREPPLLGEGYRTGDLGPFATSKWDDVQHHGRPCRLHDIDCDETWPNTEAAIDSMPVERHPPKRDSKLGDNLVGMFGQDDVIVPLRRSGLVHYAHPNVDKLGPLPEDSKENRDLLYGSARVVNSNRFLGTGDRMVPLKRAEDLQSIKPHHGDHGNHPLEDLVFGSWQEGFNRPHSEKLKADVHMFDQVRSKNTSRSTHARQVEVSCTCKIIHARAGFDVPRHFATAVLQTRRH